MTTIEPPEPGPGELTADPRDAASAVLAEAAAVLEPLEQAVDVGPLDIPRRLLVVHAHPDDETIGTGATMARYAAEHVLVTLVTCTLGEEGEVLVPELAELAADSTDQLGQHRIGELAAACEALGVTDHRFLGGPGRYRDSGMMGLQTNERSNAFWNADMHEAAGLLVAVIREVRPQVVITYDERGGYGHPDHIRAHDVTTAAVLAAPDPAAYPDAGEPWQPSKLYHSAVPRSVLQEMVESLAESGHEMFDSATSVDDLPFAQPDELITTEIDGREYFDAKLAGLRAHRTQIATDGPFFALADNVGLRAMAVEYYVLVQGERGAGAGPYDRETDLFAGIDTVVNTGMATG